MSIKIFTGKVKRVCREGRIANCMAFFGTCPQDFQLVSLTKELSEWLRVVSFACALLIVPIHASFLGQQVELSSVDRMVMKVLSDGLCRIAVPIFFVISGFFLAICWRKAQGRAWYLPLLKKRFRSIYVPFVFWNVIYFTFQFVNGKGCENWSERLLGWNPFVYPACMQFWFLQTLFIAILLAPIFIMVFCKRFVGILMLVVLFVSSFYFSFTQVLQLSNFFFISLGVVLAFNLESFERIVRRQPLPPRFLLRLSHYSFFLYAAHFIFINLATKAMAFCSLPILAMYFTKIAAGVVCSVLCAYLAKRYLPRMYLLATGGR